MLSEASPELAFSSVVFPAYEVCEKPYPGWLAADSLTAPFKDQGRTSMSPSLCRIWLIPAILC